MCFRKPTTFFPPAPQADETLYEMGREAINEVHQAVTAPFLKPFDLAGRCDHMPLIFPSDIVFPF